MLLEKYVKEMDIEADEANVSVDSGWFQLNATDVPDADQLKALRAAVGDTNALDPPSHWAPIQDPTVAQYHPLSSKDAEYQRVVHAFQSTLHAFKVKVVKVERIQNVSVCGEQMRRNCQGIPLTHPFRSPICVACRSVSTDSDIYSIMKPNVRLTPVFPCRRFPAVAMYQSYQIKLQTVCYREKGTDGSELSDEVKHKAMQRFERSWLWHGSNADVVRKITQQGFNRSFCGRNATAYGKGRLLCP